MITTRQYNGKDTAKQRRMICGSTASIFLIAAFATTAAYECPNGCTCPSSENAAFDCQRLNSPDARTLFTDLKQFASLRRLSIRRSNLRTLMTLPNLPQLQYLDLSFNHIDTIMTYGSFPNVKELNLQNNHLRVLRRDEFTTFPNVETLNLESNRIHTIDWETFRLFKLTRLYLGSNAIQLISEHMFRFTPNLQYLDMSGNRLTEVHSSNFFFSQQLKQIDLSANQLSRLEYDSFAPLYHLEMLDLSNNNFTAVPGPQLRQLAGLRSLNMSANPIEILSQGDFLGVSLEEIVITRCPRLRLIAAGAFAYLTFLHSVNVSGNANLVYISPQATARSTALQTLDASNCQLETLPSEIMQATKVGVLLAGNPLQCGCIRQELVNNQGKILDIAMARCKDDKDASIWPLSNAPSDSCRPEPIIPFGTSVVASVGATLSIFCAAKTYSNQLIWTLPDKEQMMPKREQLIAPPTDSPDHLYGRPVTTGDYSSSNSVQRLNATAEQLRFDVLLPVDSGTYQCAIKQDKHVSHRTINLTVYRPAIIIYPLEIGSHYVTVAWNASLSISSAHVRAYIYVKENGVANRAIMLSIGNPWYSYNVMRLRPDSNYTLCLTYMLGVNETIFETCTDVTTQAPLTLLSTLNLSVLFTLLIFAGLIALVCTARCLHRRFYIWQEEKYRSRMNQSISGQSFLSSNDSVASRSITYENNLPMSMSNYSNASSLASSRCTTGRRSHRPSRDLSIRDMAL